MSESAANRRVYEFDEFLNGFWNWRLLQRPSPTAPLKVIRVKILAIAIIASCLQAAGLVIKVVQYLRSSVVDWDIVMEATALLFSISIAVSQGVSHFVKRAVLEQLMANLEKLFPQTRDEQEKCNMAPYANELIRNKKLVDNLSRCSALAFTSMPLLFSLFEWLVLRKDFPFLYQFRCWYPVNAQSWLFYPFLYAFEVVISYFYGFHLINDYVFYGFATSQMRMHYRNLGRLMSELDAKKEEKNLNRLVVYHCALVKSCDDVNEIFNVTTFISFAFTKISVCMVMYTIFNGKNMIVLPTLVCVFFLLGMLVFMRCSNGAALYTDSEELLTKIYESSWYEGSPRYRRMLTFMMIRANSPVELRALKITKVKMETFKELAMDAYQIFMFLLNFSGH